MSVHGCLRDQLGMENWQYAEYKTSEAESIQNIMVTYTPSYENITAFQGMLTKTYIYFFSYSLQFIIKQATSFILFVI